MPVKSSIYQHLIWRLLISTIPLALFAFSLCTEPLGSSGNNGIGVDISIFIPVILLFGWGGFLVIESLYRFARKHASIGFMSLLAAVILAGFYTLILYFHHLS